DAIGIGDVQEISDSFAMLARMLRTSDTAPTLADGEGAPQGAWWTQVDPEGQDLARWRWDGTEWLAMPLSPEAFPEVYISKLVADEAGFKDVVVDQLFAVFSHEDESGRSSMMTDRGLMVTHADGSTAISLGTWGPDFLNLVSEDGTQAASIDN